VLSTIFTEILLLTP